MAGPPAIIVRLGERHPALQRLDPQTSFLYAPRSVAVLLLGLGLLVYYADVLGLDESRSVGGAYGSSDLSSTEAGIRAAVLVFLGYSMVQGPRTSMVRPHPVLWRLVHGLAVVYVVGLVWLLFQSASDARAFLRHISPELGVPLAFRDYATDCALLQSPAPALPPAHWWRWGGIPTPAWGVLRAALLDEFTLAHSLGWWAKALLLRDKGLLWAYSIGFELMERSFAHLLPNFNECWWDSWVLDVALCNALGICAGMATVRWLECKYATYNWRGISELKGLGPRARRGMAQLLPYSWSSLKWTAFSSPLRCLACITVVGCCLLVELNVFFLKYVLWVPPTHVLVSGRLVLWLAVGAPALREAYEWLERRDSAAAAVTATEAAAAAAAAGELAAERTGLPCGGVRVHAKTPAPPPSFDKLGAFAWLAIAMLSLETMVSVKFSRGMFTQPWPKSVLAAWACAVVGGAGALLCWQARCSARTRMAGRCSWASSQRAVPHDTVKNSHQPLETDTHELPRRRSGRSGEHGAVPVAAGRRTRTSRRRTAADM